VKKKPSKPKARGASAARPMPLARAVPVKRATATTSSPGRKRRTPVTAAPTTGVGAHATPPLRQSVGRGDVPPSGKPAGSRSKYVYCIIRSADPRRFGPVGLGAEPTEVHTVGFREIAAVISDTPDEVLDATRENVLAHERVNETVLKSFTVIPMSFGTVFKTRDDIVELLRGAYEAFRDVLDKMQDKLEFGLKVLWDRDVMIREIENDDEDIRRLKNEISAVRGSSYFARMQYGRQIEAALQVRSEQYVADIFAQLRDVSVAARANKPIGEKMIMNAAFLVSRDKETAFDAKVKEVGALYDKLNFRYTGPWPPYNFVNIRLKLERARESE
jgi:Gas vesicle synthesis protein GvpL/GvpF